MRKMVKRFLADFWVAWRRLEGLTVTEPYATAILGHELEENQRSSPFSLNAPAWQQTQSCQLERLRGGETE